MHELQIRYRQEIEELVESTRRTGELGYVASHGGNLSYKVDSNIVLITPTKVVKRKMTFDDIVMVDLRGTVLFAAPGRKPTGETPMHIRIFQKRPDLSGLVHAHPPVLTGFAIAGTDMLSQPFLPEPTIEVGPILSIDYAEPISDELAAAFDGVVERSNAFLMKNHGVLVGSPEGVGRALDFVEMLEAQAYSVYVSMVLGKSNIIAKSEVAKLERTIRTRQMPLPGDPRIIRRLTDLFV